MIDIVLCCHAGTSTSMIEQRLIKEAEKKGIEAHVHAHGVLDLPDYVNDADIILFGPQISFKLKDYQERYPEKIIISIDPFDYGMMNGENIFNNIVSALNL